MDIHYHVCPEDRVEAILAEGIRPGRGEAGAYVWRDLSMAEWFKCLHEEDGDRMAIVEVDVSGLDLRPDPETDDMNFWSSSFAAGESGGGFIHPATISPDRLKVMAMAPTP